MFIHSYNYGGIILFQEQIYFGREETGWVVATLADYLELMPKSDYRYNKTENIFKKISNAFLKAKKKGGLWVNLYPFNKDNRIDTSGSALIAYGIAKGHRVGVLGEEYLFYNNIFFEINEYLKETIFGKRLTKVIGPTVPGPRIFYRVIPYQREFIFWARSLFLTR